MFPTFEYYVVLNILFVCCFILCINGIRMIFHFEDRKCTDMVFLILFILCTIGIVGYMGWFDIHYWNNAINHL